MRYVYLAIIAASLAGCSGFFAPSEPAPIPDCSAEAWTDAKTDAGGENSKSDGGTSSESGGSSQGSSGAKAGCKDPRTKEK